MNRNRSIGIAAVVVLAMIAAPATFASQKSYDHNGEAANVIAHVPLNGPSATRMFTQYHNGHRYLYVDQGPANRVTVVDVSHPDKPVVVQSTNWPANTAAGDVTFLGSGLAITQEPVQPVAQPAPSTVNVLDVVDAGQPQVLRSFSGVTSVLSDRARNLVYIANPEGVWVVRHRISQVGWASRHMCTSEDAISPLPDCY